MDELKNIDFLIENAIMVEEDFDAIEATIADHNTRQVNAGQEANRAKMLLESLKRSKRA